MAADEVKTLKAAAIVEVQQKRNKLKEKIAEMRKKADRKNARLKQKLMSVRMKMARSMTDVYKIGENQKCVNAIKDDQSRDNYCTANVSEEFMQFQECRDTDDFCTVCCDIEFGEMHMEMRNKCYKEVCPVTKAATSSHGRWEWQNGLKLEGAAIKA